ncbi:diguanylate cyclase [Pseudoalteromonas sp.]|uniref:sensor domain-containing diguanylate cyclase n=1 Tax=Pseudoalteromonas sp. TaxID=53249 RepID=UPI0035664208
MLTPQQARQRLRRISSLNIELAESFDQLLNDLLSEGKHFLCVDKISVWLIDNIDVPKKLNCIATTESKICTSSSLGIHKYPNYFENILLGNTIAANNVATDIRTTELQSHNQTNTRAILDTVIFHNGKPQGVVSCESNIQHHIWHDEDIIYAESLADSCSRRLMAYETLKLQKQLRELAFVDTLTGLKNRRYFNERVQSAKNSQYRLQSPLSLIMIDLDHFKRINDEFGHELGDIVLKHFAKNCLGKLRLEDTLCRYGGEEFIVILPYTTEAQAGLLAERLRTSIENMSIYHEQKVVKVTASFGVAEMGLEDSIEETIKKADIAVYAAKKSGRNCVVSS